MSEGVGILRGGKCLEERKKSLLSVSQDLSLRI